MKLVDIKYTDTPDDSSVRKATFKLINAVITIYIYVFKI